ncbi:MAG: hypothetical protein HY397_00140 [Candidatus Doudnabacteria bacterium]|nr:hypothetical protein [Candidatus Doudnabacteria bacterium]
MTQERSIFKIIFGSVIFLFSNAFAFFTAELLAPSSYDSTRTLVLFIFGVIYVIVGAASAKVVAIGLGFLFSADVVILYLLFEDFPGFVEGAKLLIVGLTLGALYLYAWEKLADEPASPTSGISPGFNS